MPAGPNVIEKIVAAEGKAWLVPDSINGVTYQIDGDPGSFEVGLFYANNDGTKGEAVVNQNGDAIVLGAANPAVTFLRSYIYFDKPASSGYPFGIFQVER